MPPRNPQRNAGRPATPKREADLSSLLTAAQKTDLTLLVTNITDTLQQQIIHTFDPMTSQPHPANKNPDKAKRKSWHLLPANFDLNKTGVHLKENAKPGEQTAPVDHDPFLTIVDKEEKEALTTTQAELKKEALTFFKKWQTSLNKRLGDISAAKETVAQPGRATSSKPSSRSSRGKQPRKPVASSLSRAGTDTQMSNKDAKSVLHKADAALAQLYPPTSTTLCSLPTEKRILLLHSLLLLLLSLEHYTAYSRVLLLHLASSLQIPLHILAEDEVRVAKGLSQMAKELCIDESPQKKSEEGKASRRGKTGSASATGAASTGVAGVLAAPLAIAGIGTIKGGLGVGPAAAAGLLGPMVEGGIAVGTLFGLYGARGAGKMLESYVRDVPDFAFLSLHGTLGTEFREAREVPPDNRRLRCTIGISGWLTRKEDITNPWRVMGHQSETFALKWELEALTKTGNALETVMKSAAWSVAKKEITSRTIFASLLQAMWPISLLRISKIVDNPWSVGMVRADKVGAVLADAIMNKVQGERGVTLVGYSLGARVVYACLMNLAERRAFGLVENAVLMGTPAPSDGRVWSTLRSIVAGRLVNVFSDRDYILGFLYRTSSIQFGVAGLERIEGVPGVENANATALISSHLRYQYLSGVIMQNLDWEDIDQDEAAKNEGALALAEERVAQDERRRDGVDMDREIARLEEVVGEKNGTRALEAKVETMRIST